MTGHLDEAARLLRDAETDQYTARARWMLDLARTHAAIAQAEATARLADQLAYRRADNRATQALLAPYEPEHGVEPATDEQIEAWDGWPLTTHRASMVIARVRQEQDRADGWKGSCRDWEDTALKFERERDEAVARAEKAERERDEAVARADELKGIRWRADAATRKAQERAEAAEAEVARMRPVVQAAVAEVARMRPVVQAAVDWDMAMVDLDDLAVAVAEYRAARKKAGGKSWLPAQDFIGGSLRAGACPDCPPGGGECDVCGGTGRAAEDA